MRKATVEGTVPLNLAPRRVIMSKSIALGLLGAGAILLWDFGNARQYPTLRHGS